jgi:hypothetical protein
MPALMRRCTDPTQIFRRRAVSSTLFVSGPATAASNAGTPSRSRRVRTRSVVQDSPSFLLHRIQFMVTASCRSGQFPPSVRITYRARLAVIRISASPRACQTDLPVPPYLSSEQSQKLRLFHRPDRRRVPVSGSGSTAAWFASSRRAHSRPMRVSVSHPDRLMAEKLPDRSSARVAAPVQRHPQERCSNAIQVRARPDV